MSKGKIIKVCNIVAFILTLSFLLKLVRDWFVYSTTLNSAPFYLWVMVDAAYYLLPAACIFLVGRFVQVKKRRKNKKTIRNPTVEI